MAGTLHGLWGFAPLRGVGRAAPGLGGNARFAGGAARGMPGSAPTQEQRDFDGTLPHTGEALVGQLHPPGSAAGLSPHGQAAHKRG